MLSFQSQSQSPSLPRTSQAIVRCKKAQALARPHNVKETIKAGIIVEEKLHGMLELSKDMDFGGLTNELETLHKMIINMQKAVLEPFLESVETIERRMQHYLQATNKSTSTSAETDKQSEETAPQSVVQAEDTRIATVSSADSQDVMGDTDSEAIHRRFFDRLGSFFQMQDSCDERAAAADPQGKIAGMKMKPHSKGIHQTDGSYKASYRQQDMYGRPVQHLSDLYLAAECAFPNFKTVLSDLIKDVAGLGEGDLDMAEIKSRDRAAEKAREEYNHRQPGPPESWLYDILRASIECTSFKQMSSVNRWLIEKVHIVDCENRFLTPRFDGYRDIIYFVAIPYKDDVSFICEIQVHHKELRPLLGDNPETVYFRPFFSGSTRDDFDSVRDMEMLLQLGYVDNQLMEFLLESGDPSQLRLFARLFFEKLEETDKALELYKRVLTMEESTYGKGNIITWSTYEQIGLTLLKTGDTDGALLYLREGLGVLEMNLGSGHPEVAVAHNHIGDALTVMGCYDESLGEFSRALTIREESLGEDHLFVADSHLAAARTLCSKAQYQNALLKCRSALLIQETNLGDVHERCAASHALIGDILMELAQYDMASESYEKVLSIQEATKGREHQQVANALTSIGHVKLEQGRLDEAESLFRRCLEMRERKLGNSHSDCAISYSDLGSVLRERGDFKGALTVHRLGLRIRTKSLGKHHYQTSLSLYELGELFASMGSYEDALRHHEECLSLRKQIFGHNHPTTAQALNAMGRVKTRQRDFVGAHDLHKKAMSIQERTLGGNHREVANTYQLVAETYLAENNFEQCIQNLQMALTIRSDVLGDTHPETTTSRVLMTTSLREKIGRNRTVEMECRHSLVGNEGQAAENQPPTIV